MKTSKFNTLIITLFFFVISLPLMAMNSTVIYDNPEHTSGSFTLLSSDCTQEGWNYYFEVTVPANTLIKVECNYNEKVYAEIYTDDGFFIEDFGPFSFSGSINSGSSGKFCVFISDNYIGGPYTFNLRFVAGSYSATEDSYIHGNSIVDGSVGIGTLIPSGRLSIYSNNQYSLHSQSINYNNPNSSFGIYSYAYNNSGPVYGLYSYVNGGGTLNQRWAGYFYGGDVVVYSGKLGVGTTTPSEMLDVRGNISVSTDPYSKIKLMKFPDHASWIDMPVVTNKASGIGSGGAGNNLWIGYAGKACQWFMNSSTGDICYRNTEGKLLFGNTTGNAAMAITGDSIGIGTVNPKYKLDVLGTIRAKEVLVDLNGVPDYVFEENYKLPSIEHVAAFVKANKHLPDIPSAAEIEKNGVSLNEMQIQLLKKIEELTLYTIQQQKEIQVLKLEVQQLKAK